MKNNIVAIIPARGGSKGIPKKNIVDFCRKPLLAWTIEQAKKSKKIDGIYVSTDDKEIVNVARKYGAETILRPKEISGDTANVDDALKHAINKITKGEIQKPGYIVFLQTTSPLREPEDIDNAVDKIIDENADSLFSGAEIGDFYIWRKKEDRLESINYDYRNRERRQDFEKQFGKQYVENGSIYIFKPEILFKYNNHLGGKIAIYEMDFWKSFEVDNREDLQLCKDLFKLKKVGKG